MVRMNIDPRDENNDPYCYIHHEDCPIAKRWMDNPGKRKIIVKFGGNPDGVVIDKDHDGGWIEFATEKEAISYRNIKYPHFKLKLYSHCSGCISA